MRVVATMGVDGPGARVTYLLPGAEPMVVAVQDGNVENRSVTEELHARTAPPSDLFRMIDTYLADLATLPGSVTGPADRLVEAAHPVRDRCADICAAECYHYNCYDCIPYVWDLWCQICTSTCSLGCAIGCA